LTPHEILEKLLKLRGIKDFEKYFNPDPKYLEKSDSLLSLEKTKIIADKLTKANKIIIYSDYDVDGVTSSAIFSQFLYEMGVKNFDVVIPNRFKDGYGLNLTKLKNLYTEDPFDMIITFDCGINSVEEVRFLKEKGVFVVITDHHLPLTLPDADIIINPKMSSTEEKGDYNLCGCGVAFKLIHLLKMTLGLKELDLRKYLDRVALATVADIVPLIGDNRILVKHGLDQINRSPSVGIKALKNIAKINGEITSYHLGFVLGPMINASGRLDIADTSYHLLIQEDDTLAVSYAKTLENLNLDRQKECDLILEEATSMLKSESLDGICLYQKHWNKGVIGIVASRLVERYNAPTILFGTGVDKEDDNGVISGSGRSVNGIPLFDILVRINESMPELLLRFGGHTKACGLSIYEENFENFYNIFLEILSEFEKVENTVRYDFPLNFSDINFELINYIKKMEPFGYGNESPRFLFKDVNIIDYRSLGNGKHFSLNLIQGKYKINGIWFNGIEDKIRNKVDVIGTPDINEYNENKYIQLKIMDII